MKEGDISQGRKVFGLLRNVISCWHTTFPSLPTFCHNLAWPRNMDWKEERKTTWEEPQRMCSRIEERKEFFLQGGGRRKNGANWARGKRWNGKGRVWVPYLLPLLHSISWACCLYKGVMSWILSHSGVTGHGHPWLGGRKMKRKRIASANRASWALIGWFRS